MKNRIVRLAALPLCLVLLAACSQEGTPYTEKTAAIDPALNSTPAPPTPSTDVDEGDNPMPERDETPSTDQANNTGDSPKPSVEVEKVTLTDEQWREVLSEQEFYVLRRSGTEAPGSHKYNQHDLDKKGAFHCVGCGHKLYDAKHKFHSGCGWPSFSQHVEPGAITEHRDTSAGMIRVEMRCARCDGHLGHIFDDGFIWNTETGLRHCVNGTAIIFVPEGEDVKDIIRDHRAKHASK